MSTKWLSLLALAIAGVLAGHLVGYGAVSGLGVTSGAHHGHLDLLVDVLLPLGTIALVAIALAHPRRSGWDRGLTVPRLAGLQSLLYVALEWGERAAQGLPAAELASAPVLAGFLAQLMIAVLVVWAVRLTWRMTCPAEPISDPWGSIAVMRSKGPGTVASMEVRGAVAARAPPRPLVP